MVFHKQQLYLAMNDLLAQVKISFRITSPPIHLREEKNCLITFDTPLLMKFKWKNSFNTISLIQFIRKNAFNFVKQIRKAK